MRPRVERAAGVLTAGAGLVAALLSVACDGELRTEHPAVAPPSETWARGFGSTGRDVCWSVVFGAGDSVYAAGTFEGTVDFGGGPLTSAGDADVFVVKLDHDGNHLWSRRFGGEGSEYYPAIALDSAGALYLHGVFEGTYDFGGPPLEGYGLALAKLTSSGEHVWSTAVGNLNYYDAFRRGFAVTPGGETFVFTGSLEAGQPFLLKYDAGGALAWSKALPEGGYMLPAWRFPIAADATSGAVIAGEISGELDLGNGPHEGYFAASVGNDGSLLWDRYFPGGGFGLMTVSIDGEGSVLLAGVGSFDVGIGPTGGDAFAAKLDAGGEAVWSRAFWNIHTNGLAADPAGRIAVAGETSPEVDLGGGPVKDAPEGGCVGRLSADGEAEWVVAFRADSALAVAASPTGRIATCGVFNEPMTIAGEELPHGGADDAFIAVFEP